MLIELFILVAAVLVLTLLLLLLSQIVRDQWAYARFKKLSGGMPMCDGARLLGNHTDSVMFGTQNCEKLRKLHGQVGKTIGYMMGDKFCVSTVDLDLVKTIALDEPEIHVDRMRCAPLEEFRESLLDARGDQWRNMRRAIAPAFTNNKIKTPNVQEDIEQSIGKLLAQIDRQLAREPGHLFEVDDLAQKYSIDLVFRSFYKQGDVVDFDDPRDYWTQLIEHSFTQFGKHPLMRLAVTNKALSRLFDWIIWHFDVMGRGRRQTLEYIEQQTKLSMRARKELAELRRRARETGERVDADNFVLKDGTRFRRNMVDYITEQYLEGRLSKADYNNNLVGLMSAANRTASDCIIHTLYQLSIDQALQDRLRDSIASEGADSEYLEWVLKESMRVLPPVSLGCSRTVERELKTSDGYTVPKGTFVTTCAYVIHRLEEYWGEDAHEFRPERWQDTSKHHPVQYVPFGLGPRRCPGQAFAMHEMKMLFAALLTRYRFAGEPRDDVYNFDAPFMALLAPKSPTRARVELLR